MDPRERYRNEEETQRVNQRALQSRLWTALPGVVVRYPGSAGNPMTVDVQPAVNGLQRNTDGTTSPIAMPTLLDLPVLWQGGGGVTLVFPIEEGDECLAIFSSRCIDGWYSQGVSLDPIHIPDPPSSRMHDLSDGFALVGVRSLPNAYELDAGVVRLRTDDDSMYWEFNSIEKTIALQASGGITINGATIDSSGNIVSPGTVTGTTNVYAGAGGTKVDLLEHVHPGTDDPPTPGS
jgi:protein gp138